MAALGQWTARVTGTGHDNSGLECWLYIALQGPNNTQFFITRISSFGTKPPQLGSNTDYDQQFQLLLAKGQAKPDP